jgi:hypothetical protein
MAGSKQVDHWTSGTVYECSEIAGSPHDYDYDYDYDYDLCVSAGQCRSPLSQHGVKSAIYPVLVQFLV